MGTIETKRLRDAFIEFCSVEGMKSPYAVTLTLKAARHLDYQWIPLTQIDAAQNLRHFLNVISKKLRKAGLAKGYRPRCVPVLEGNDVIRKHYHLIIDKPEVIGPEEFAFLIGRSWRNTYWGHEQVTVRPCYDGSGWLRYIAKPRTKVHYADSIDWMNFN